MPELWFYRCLCHANTCQRKRTHHLHVAEVEFDLLLQSPRLECSSTEKKEWEKTMKIRKSFNFVDKQNKMSKNFFSRHSLPHEYTEHRFHPQLCLVVMWYSCGKWKMCMISMGNSQINPKSMIKDSIQLICRFMECHPVWIWVTDLGFWWFYAWQYLIHCNTIAGFPGPLLELHVQWKFRFFCTFFWLFLSIKT